MISKQTSDAASHSSPSVPTAQYMPYSIPLIRPHSKAISQHILICIRAGRVPGIQDRTCEVVWGIKTDRPQMDMEGWIVD